MRSDLNTLRLNSTLKGIEANYIIIHSRALFIALCLAGLNKHPGSALPLGNLGFAYPHAPRGVFSSDIKRNA